MATTIEPAVASGERVSAPLNVPARDVVEPPSWRSPGWLEGVMLGGVVALAGTLRLLLLDREGYGNTYYAAAVWSMLQDWRAFLFASFDAGGFVTVDKPPVGLWVQALSARLLGFGGVALLLPQAVAGIASVVLLWWLVRRVAGPWAGLAAAAVLAVTPITVVTDRNNTMDSQLVLVLLLALWAVSRAAETGRLRLLLGSAVLVGLGFNIKMLQAYPVLPGFALAYGLLAPVSRGRRLRDLAVAGTVLIAVSLSWSAVVDLTPPEMRPYVGSSGSNSALSLALGYNGLSRLTMAIAEQVPALSFLGTSIDLTVAPAFAPGIGQPRLGRLFDPALAGQASWLLGLALAGLGVGAWQVARPSAASSGSLDGLRRRRVALVVWGGWLLVWGAIFSFARFYHIYYLAMLGPAVAALVGLGLAGLWQAYRQSTHPVGWWLLPLVLASGAGLQASFLAPYAVWAAWLRPLVLGACGLAVATLVVRLFRPNTPGPWSAAVAGGALVSLLVAPLVWSAVSVQNGDGGTWLPEAGPPPTLATQGRSGPLAGGGAPLGARGASPVGGARGSPILSAGPAGGTNTALTFAGQQWNQLDPGLVAYLQANQGNVEYLVATASSTYASVFILATGQPAMALGGYQGWDRILTPEELARLVADGTVRFFYLSVPTGRGAAVTGQNGTSDLEQWVAATCTVVPPSTWGSTTSTSGRPAGMRTQGLQLYDCAPVN